MASWTTGGTLPENRVWLVDQVQPLNNGKILAFCGLTTGDAFLATYTVYDPGAGTWSASVATPFAGRYLSSSCLNDVGDPVMTAGWTGNVSTTCYRYDAGSDTWTVKPSLPYATSAHKMIRLANGDILAFGGAASAGPANAQDASYRRDKTTENWSAADLLNTPRWYPQASLLPDGRVLMTGGQNGSGAVAACELYDPVANTWTATGSLNNARFTHGQATLPDGRVIVHGGFDGTNNVSTTEIWDPGTELWTSVSTVAEHRYFSHLARTPQGLIARFGGADGVTSTVTAHTYEPHQGVWSLDATAPSIHHTTAGYAVIDNKIYVVGGYNFSAAQTNALGIGTLPAPTYRSVLVGGRGRR